MRVDGTDKDGDCSFNYNYYQTQNSSNKDELSMSVKFADTCTHASRTMWENWILMEGKN